MPRYDGIAYKFPDSIFTSGELYWVYRNETVEEGDGNERLVFKTALRRPRPGPTL